MFFCVFFIGVIFIIVESIENMFEYLVHDYINMLTFVFKLHGITLVICTQ